MLGRQKQTRQLSRVQGTGVVLSLAISLTLQSGPACGSAEHEDYADMSLKELMSLEVFTAASLMPTEYSKAPGTVYTFDRDDFRRLGIRRLDDLLAFVPGLQLNQYRKRHRSIWARGTLDRYNDKFVLLVDGVQKRHLYYGHFSLGDNFPLQQVEKMEIILGPASSLYGANAFAGLISITTRNFSDRPQVEATLEVGDNQRAGGTLMYNSPSVQVFAGNLQQDAPFRDDRKSFIGSEVLQPTDEDFTDLQIKAQPADGLTLSLDYHKDQTPFLFIPPTQDAFVENSFWSLAAKYEHGNVDSGRLEATLSYTRDNAHEYEIEQQTRRIAYTEDQNAAFANISLTGFKRLFNDHVFALGASWQREKARDMNYVRYFRWDSGFFDQPMPGPLLSEPDVRNDDFALFLQDVWTLRDDLTLTLGARFDKYDAFGDHTNYRAALVYTPDDRQVIKLLYGTAIRTPNYREYLKVLEGTDFIAPVPNPERIESLELGYLYQWDVANLSITLFQNEIKDYIHEVPTPDGADEYFTNSLHPWEMRGLETLFQFRLGSRLQMRFGASYLDAREQGADDLPYLSDWNASFNLNYDYLSSHMAGFSLVYGSDREETNAYTDDTPGDFVLVNLHGSGRFSRNLGYAFGVDNLFDERIFDPAADFGGQHNTERSEREVWARLEWNQDL